MTTRTALLITILLPLSLVGCAPGDDPDPPVETTLESPDPGDGLQLTAGTDRAEYVAGDSIRVVVRLTNRLDEARSITFPTAQRYDLLILTDEGEEVYHWGGSQMFAQVVGEERLEAGAHGPEWIEWIEAPVEPGSYRIRALVPVDGGELRADLPIEIVSS